VPRAPIFFGDSSSLGLLSFAMARTHIFESFWPGAVLVECPFWDAGQPASRIKAEDGNEHFRWTKIPWHGELLPVGKRIARTGNRTATKPEQTLRIFL